MVLDLLFTENLLLFNVSYEIFIEIDRTIINHIQDNEIQEIPSVASNQNNKLMVRICMYNCPLPDKFIYRYYWIYKLLTFPQTLYLKTLICITMNISTLCTVKHWTSLNVLTYLYCKSPKTLCRILTCTLYYRMAEDGYTNTHCTQMYSTDRGYRHTLYTTLNT